MSNWTDKQGRRHVGVMLGGKRVHRILAPGASASDAKRIESEIRAAIGSRATHIPGSPTMAQVMGLYLPHAATLRSPKTARNHALRLGPWLDGYNAADARAVAANVIRDMSPHYAAATINRSLSALSKALRMAWETNLVAQDYSAHIKMLPENNQRSVVLTIEQVQALSDASSEQVRAAIWIALYTACRRGEICKLRAQDIGRDTLTVQAGNTKTLRTRVVPIIAPLRPWLRYVPLAINFEGVKSGFRRAREKAGLPDVTFHDLRRSCATMMIAAGVDLYAVSKLLGHSSIAVTQARYAHLQVGQVRDGLRHTFG